MLVFEPPDGGVAEHVAQLARALPGHGWQVTVAGPEEAAVYPQLERAGVPIARLPIGRALRPVPYARALGMLAALARRRRPQVMHVHSSKAGAIGRLAARATGVPVVYTPHCFAFIGPHGARRVAATVSLERALAALTDAIVCVADAERQEALRRRVGRPERLHVVRNGSPECPQELEPDPELAAFAAGGPLAACLTVLRAQKAVDVFLRAAPRILAHVPGARLAVIGNGPMRGPLEELHRRLGLDERVRFFDFRAPAARQLACLDVFVLPSAWEAFPISILEALACGVPQVATDVGGTAEAVLDGTTGLLCPPSDSRALADAVAELLADPDRRERMSRASVERHRARFGMGRMVLELLKVYDEVASPSGGATVGE